MLAFLVACVAQSADGTIAWRARNVAGREVVMEGHGIERSGLQGGTEFEWSERVRDVVVAFDGRLGSGMRVDEFTQDDFKKSYVSAEFFDVDAAGGVHPRIGFEFGHVSPRSRALEFDWTRRIALRVSDLAAQGAGAFTASLEAVPPALCFALGNETRFRASLAPAEAGAARIEIVPSDALPIELPDPVDPRRLTKLNWTAQVDAHGVLSGESTDATVDCLDSNGKLHLVMRTEFSWRETTVAQAEGDSLVRLRAEVDALRRAHEASHRTPETALERLDDYAKLPAPRRFDSVADWIREGAKSAAEGLDRDIARALVLAAGGDKESKLPHLDQLLNGGRLTKAVARELLDFGARIAWVEPDPVARSRKTVAVVRACAARFGLDDAERRRAAAVVMKGIESESFWRRHDDPSSPAPDLDAVSRSIDVAFTPPPK